MLSSAVRESDAQVFYVLLDERGYPSSKIKCSDEIVTAWLISRQFCVNLLPQHNKNFCHKTAGANQW